MVDVVIILSTSPDLNFAHDVFRSRGVSLPVDDRPSRVPVRWWSLQCAIHPLGFAILLRVGVHHITGLFQTDEAEDMWVWRLGAMIDRLHTRIQYDQVPRSDPAQRDQHHRRP